MTRSAITAVAAAIVMLSSACGQVDRLTGASDPAASAPVSTSAATESPESGDTAPPPPSSGAASPTTEAARTTTTPAPATPPPTTAPTIPIDELAGPGDLGLSELRIVEPGASPAVNVDATDCAPTWTSAPPVGTAEITFVVDGTLWSITPDGANPTCLAKVGDVAVATWKPTADQLLVDQNTIIDERGPRPNGLSATEGVEWSRPTGKALIVPSPDAASLVHVETDDPSDVTDIAALSQTWQAIYYPSGMSVIASGVDASGVAGLFLATNLGAIRRPIATLNDPDTRITDMSMLSDGSGVMFTHDHRHVGADGEVAAGTASTGDAEGVLSHVHLLTLPDLTFVDVAALHNSVVTGLVTAMDGNHEASFAADASTVGSTTGIWYRFTDRHVTPVGIDAEGNTYAIVSKRPGGGGQLWKLPTTGPDVPATVQPVLLATGVSNAMVRLQQGKYSQLPDEIEAQAPG